MKEEEIMVRTRKFLGAALRMSKENKRSYRIRKKRLGLREMPRGSVKVGKRNMSRWRCRPQCQFNSSACHNIIRG